MERLERIARCLQTLESTGTRVIAMWVETHDGVKYATYAEVSANKAELVDRLAHEGADVRQLWWLAEWPEVVSEETQADLGRVGREPLLTTAGDATVLRDAVTAIKAVREQNEQTAVAVAKRLAVIASFAREHGESLEKMAREYHEEGDVTTLVAAMKNLVQSLSAFRSVVTDELANHTFLVERACQSVDSLAKLSTTIGEFSEASRVATFNARIEAARIGEEGKGFVSIANSLQQLAKEVRVANGIASTISRQLGDGLPRVARSTTSLSEHVEGQLRTLTANVEAIRQSVENNKMAAEIELDRVTERAGRLREQTSEAVTELQYQDRSNQLIETVSESLIELLNGGSQHRLAELRRRGRSLVEDEAAAQAGAIELF